MHQLQRTPTDSLRLHSSLRSLLSFRMTRTVTQFPKQTLVLQWLEGHGGGPGHHPPGLQVGLGH
jgi:hypothetical protein